MRTLFEQSQIGGLNMKNRFVRAAIGDQAEGGAFAGAALDNYRKLAEGGVGAIITGFILVDEREAALPVPGLYDDCFIAGHKELTDTVHASDIPVLAQLAYAGAIMAPQEGAGGLRILGPSSVANQRTGVVPKEMTNEEIRSIQQGFAQAAVRAKEAGYDGVEIHGAHNFLLSQFVTPHYNRRTDEYGGTIENRARMLLETYRTVREAVGVDFPVWVKVNSDDFMENGVSKDDCFFICRQLAAEGADAVEISGNWSAVMGQPGILFLDAAARIAAAADISVILTGGCRDCKELEEILQSTQIEAFGMARPFMKEPEIIGRLQDEWKR